MALKAVQEAAVGFDTVCDYIPVVSAATNIISLVVKIALEIFEAIDVDLHRSILQQPLFKHYDDKSVLVCILLCIPGLNFIVALVRDSDEVSDARERTRASEANYNNRMAELRERGSAALMQAQKAVELAESSRQGLRKEQQDRENEMLQLLDESKAKMDAENDPHKKELWVSYIQMLETTLSSSRQLAKHLGV